jgi:single-stranded-DNA-specific exonuclease
LNLELAEQLRAAGPWGQRFPEPLFDGVFVVKSQRIVGEKHLKLRLGLPGEILHMQIEAIAFNVDTSDLAKYSAYTCAVSLSAGCE